MKVIDRFHFQSVGVLGDSFSRTHAQCADSAEQLPGWIQRRHDAGQGLAVVALGVHDISQDGTVEPGCLAPVFVEQFLSAHQSLVSVPLAQEGLCLAVF